MDEPAGKARSSPGSPPRILPGRGRKEVSLPVGARFPPGCSANSREGVGARGGRLPPRLRRTERLTAIGTTLVCFMAAPLAGLSVLVVDDEPLLRRGIAAHLERFGADVQSADSLAGTRRLVTEQGFDFVLLDVHLPDGRGTDLLSDGTFPSGTGVIVMTAEGGISGAVDAIKAGALDYLTKPFEPAALAHVMTRARQTRQSARAEEHKRQDAPENQLFFGSALASIEQSLKKVLAADRRLHGTGTASPPVLIQGETGTGKTLIARWLHQNGPRAEVPLVEANCAAIPESLAESEFFGHEKGAFTDARSGRIGLFEAAQDGTLFLDEVASLSLGLQAKLLTVLESGRIRRVGASKDIPVDVRIIAAANVDLRQAVAAGHFRDDLYHRLDLFRLFLPPLRERGQDLLALAQNLLSRVVRRHRLQPKKLSEAGQRRLLAYSWPGNVRELSHELERALVFEDAPEIQLENLLGIGGNSSRLSEKNPAAATSDSANPWFNPNFRFPDSGFQLEQAILHLVNRAMEQTSGNVSGAARLLGVTRDYVRYRLGDQRHGPSTQ